MILMGRRFGKARENTGGLQCESLRHEGCASGFGRRGGFGAILGKPRKNLLRENRARLFGVLLGGQEGLSKKAGGEGFAVVTEGSGRGSGFGFGRGQAGVFDGITLLLLASLSSAMIFSFIGGYGVQQDRVIRSAYVLNYMQSVVKASYHLDASTLATVDNKEEGRGARGSRIAYPLDIYDDLNDRNKGCFALGKYYGSFSVSDLLKRDLAEELPKLDDKFDGSDILGVTAMQCAMKELLKPFTLSGFYYGFDVLDDTGAAVRVEPSSGYPNYPYIKMLTDYKPFLKSGAGTSGVCLAASSARDTTAGAQEITSDIVSVRVPFKVVYINTKKDPPIRDIRNYELAVCIWRPKN